MRVLTPSERKAIARLARDSRLTYTQIGQRFGISKSTVSQIAIDGGVRRSLPWTESDVAFLTENYQTRGAAGCAKILGRDRQAVWHKAKSLGLSTDVGPYGRLRVYKGGKE